MIQLPSYPGGKNGPGVYQTLINHIPPHDVFVSAFAGHCGVLQNKRPAGRNIAIDLDRAPLESWASAVSCRAAGNGTHGSFEIELFNCDCLEWLRVTFELDRIGTAPPQSAASR